MLKLKIRTNYIFVILLLFIVNQSFAQPKIVSPYSRYGLGDLVNPNITNIASMGGVAATYNDPLYLNTVNPASYAFLQATAYDVGFNVTLMSLKDNYQSQNLWTGNLNNLALAFPLKNTVTELLHKRKRNDWYFGMGFNLMPFSNVGYDIQSTVTDANMGDVTYKFQGNGGTYKVQWGNAIRYKDFSIGANVGYFFGKTTYERTISFNSYTAAFQDRLSDYVSVGGITYNVGAQYNYIFKKKKADGTYEATGPFITLGVYGNPSSKFTTTTDQYYRGVNSGYTTSAGASVVDTLSLPVAEKAGKGALPSQYGFGIAAGITNKWRLAANYQVTNWSEYNNEGKTEYVPLQNTSMLSFGGEYIPDIAAYNSYKKRIRYRAGFFYGTDPRVVGGGQLSTAGLNLGIGLPIILPRQQTSFVNLGLEFGSLNGAVLKDNYAKLSISFTMNDNSWFYKSKFR